MFRWVLYKDAMNSMPIKKSMMSYLICIVRRINVKSSMFTKPEREIHMQETAKHNSIGKIIGSDSNKNKRRIKNHY